MESTNIPTRPSGSASRRVHVVGRKNSGKTTLIVDLVECLTARGLRIGTIKHTHHEHELDIPGKDSYRHRQAGATPVGILTPHLNAVYWSPAAPVDDESRYTEMMLMFRDCNLVLVEGHLGGPGIKIEVWRRDNGGPPLADNDGSIQAVVTDDATSLCVPVWSRSEIAALAERFLKLVREPLPRELAAHPGLPRAEQCSR